MDKTIMKIAANTQVSFHDLRIGVGYIGIDSTTNEKINSAQIWPFLRDEVTGRPSILVHEKDIVDLGVYQLKILDINKDSVKIQIALLENITKD